MAEYSGGPHPAEFIAKDGAGNVVKRSWTINVDPEGHISASEAEDTLEAVESTSTANLVGPSQVEPEVEGSGAGLGIEPEGTEIVTSGTAVPAAISVEPAEGATFEIADTREGAEPCLAGPLDPEDPSLFEPSPPCEQEALPYDTYKDTISADASGISEAASNTTPANGNAALAANTAQHVDTITRPLYEGALIFQSIRDSQGPEEFSWTITLESGQELKLIDSQHAMVYYGGGHEAFSISAQPAADAVGTTVDTALSVQGSDQLTLKVQHRNKSLVYPVMRRLRMAGRVRFRRNRWPRRRNGNPGNRGTNRTGRTRTTRS